MKIEQDVSIQFMKQEEKEENEGKEEDEGEEKVEIKRKEAEMAESTDEEDETISLGKYNLCIDHIHWNSKFHIFSLL